MTTPTDSPDPVRVELVEAAIGLLASDGVESLVLRRVASAAHVSTMCVYSRFGDKHGLINAVYADGFRLLDEAMSEVGETSEPVTRLIELAVAYRRFALANPALYSLMFERVPGFDRPPDTVSGMLGPVFSRIVDAMTAAIEAGTIEADSPAIAAYTFWTAIHGSVSIELTHSAIGPMSDLLTSVSHGSEGIYLASLHTTLRGMTPSAPVIGRR